VLLTVMSVGYSVTNRKRNSYALRHGYTARLHRSERRNLRLAISDYVCLLPIEPNSVTMSPPPHPHPE
jgi:hypothetical protein